MQTSNWHCIQDLFIMSFLVKNRIRICYTTFRYFITKILEETRDM